jgi:thioredoxin reductase
MDVDVLVIGGGPAGLSAAREVCGRLGASVTVVDRESSAGGIPRHSDHPGYGIRDLRRLMSGPAYARELTDRAAAAGARILTSTTVTGWSGERTVWVSSPEGRFPITASSILLATGARERPRTARMVPGDRPAGVFTTGQLQNTVHLHHRWVGSRAVIVGSELVSWSAAVTLREAGCRTVLMTSEQPRLEAYAAFTVPGSVALRFPTARRTRVTRVMGKDRVTGVEIENLDTGQRRVIACDTVVFTGDWIADGELARMAGVVMDGVTGGPVVDTALRTSAPGVFAAGNLVHPVDTADVAALDGVHAARQIERYLGSGDEGLSRVRILADPPLRWISPGILRAGDPPPARGRYLAWVDDFVTAPRVVIRQSGTVVAERRLPWPAAPGRVFRIPSAMFVGVDTCSGDVSVGIA